MEMSMAHQFGSRTEVNFSNSFLASASASASLSLSVSVSVFPGAGADAVHGHGCVHGPGGLYAVPDLLCFSHPGY